VTLLAASRSDSGSVNIWRRLLFFWGITSDAYTGDQVAGVHRSADPTLANGNVIPLIYSTDCMYNVISLAEKVLINSSCAVTVQNLIK